MQPTIFFQSLGCAKNLVDSEVMLGISLHDGFQVVADPKEAKVIVINTCSFIEASKKESIDTILEMADYKKTGSCDKLIVAGCLAQRYKADLKVSFPEVDAFIGTGQYVHLPDFIAGKKEDDFGFKNPKYIHSENTPRVNSQPSHRAYLKVSEGCIKNCAFCIIPKIRGTLRSRTIESLTIEAQNLVNQGVKELNLIAQDLTDYGRDLKGNNLVGLLKSLSTIEGLSWIRLLYVYPDELNDELLELIATEKKICKYIDTPIQHINDRVLSLMNRKVTGRQIRERLSVLRKTIPGVSIRSALIVGYPGETEEEFNELKDFVKEEAFIDNLGVFTYSHEENTASYSLPGQHSQETKDRRKDELLTVQQSVSKILGKKRVGKTLPVLLEEKTDSPSLWRGRHEGQAPDIDGCVLVRGQDLMVGAFVEATIEKALEYDLVGKHAPRN